MTESTKKVLPCILLAESDNSLALELSQAMEQTGFEVVHEPNGEKALATVRNGNFPIIVASHNLSGISGSELIQQIQDDEQGFHHFVLINTDSTNLDVDWVLSHPIDLDDYVAKLLAVARTVQIEQEALQKQLAVDKIQNTLELANKSLTIASRRFEELFRGLPVASFTFDGEGVIHEWNRQSEVLFDMKAFQVFDRAIWDVMGEASLDLWNRETVASVIAGNPIAHREWTFSKGANCEHYLVCSIIPLTGGTGTIVGAISANIDITDRVLAERQIEWQMQEITAQKAQLEEANRQLEYLAQTDGLTGLTNRRKLFEVLEGYIADESLTLSAILMDVDSFKSYNDTFGHIAGDQVLRSVAKVASEAVGERGIVARYGGEEFTVILANSTAENAIQVAEEVRAAIEGFAWDLRAITVSVGVSTRQPGHTITEFLSQCDTGLYMAKGTGKNRVVHFLQMTEDDLASWSKAA